MSEPTIHEPSTTGEPKAHRSPDEVRADELATGREAHHPHEARTTSHISPERENFARVNEDTIQAGVAQVGDVEVREGEPAPERDLIPGEDPLSHDRDPYIAHTGNMADVAADEARERARADEEARSKEAMADPARESGYNDAAADAGNEGDVSRARDNEADRG